MTCPHCGKAVTVRLEAIDPKVAWMADFEKSDRGNVYKRMEKLTVGAYRDKQRWKVFAIFGKAKQFPDMTFTSLEEAKGYLYEFVQKETR